MPTASLSNINVVGRRTEPEIQGQDVSPFTELEKQIHDAKIESSKSINSVLEEGEKANWREEIEVQRWVTTANSISYPVSTNSHVA
ncbi:unnamed protein product [Rhizophagus irregularis]|nr:unnamed protein product [Rhizophagus irregularis]